MDTYNNQLTDDERECVEWALSNLKKNCAELGIRLANDDRAAHAAEALARYIVASRS